MRNFGPLQLLGVLVVVALATAVAGALRPVDPGEPGKQITPGATRRGDEYRRDLERIEPELVLVGNSVLDAAVNTEQLEELTGLRTYKLMIHGSASAMWYASLKYGVLEAGHRPKYAIVVFRDLFLTYPTYRTDSRYQPLLNYFAAGDPLVQELVYDPPIDPITDLLNDHWPLYRVRGDVRDSIEHWAREGLLGALLGVDEGTIDEAVASTFATKNMVPELATEEEEVAGVSNQYLPYFDFDRQIDRCFLPAMIEMTEEAGVKLILVRVRARRDVPERIAARGLPEYAEAILPEYIENLGAYLDRRGVSFIDFTDEDAFRLEHYAVGDHLTVDVGQSLFTRLLAERLAKL